MAVDLTVAAVPVYFATMAAEHRWLDRRAQSTGPTAGDYAKPDTLASLAMGSASLVVPLAAHAVASRFVPGRGRFPNVLVRTAVAAVAATTVADRLATLDRDDGGAPVSARRSRIAGAARRVAAVGGPVALAAGALTAATTVKHRTDANRQWRANGGRDLGGGVVGWTAAIAGWDFVYYWNHRFMHEVRAMWAMHVVHHSSERYNLSTALRQPVADVLCVFVPYGMLARVGVRPALLAHARGINLLYQYWIHTDAVRRLGPVEEVLNTPSHHRVHHGANARYIDRNHGSILIVWDRLFGTFQREREPVVYGLTTNIDSFSPVRIATHEYRDIVRDVAASTTWRDRLSFALRGPGWAYRRHAETAARVSPPRGAEPADLVGAGVA